MSNYIDELFNGLFDLDNSASLDKNVFSVNLAGTKKEDIKLQVKGRMIKVNDQTYSIRGQGDLEVEKSTYRDGMLKVYLKGSTSEWSKVDIT